ncbi:hypothetical protein OMK68_24750 [Rhodococcus pyridinivorans]|uniref:hypothetical protein n=1 Tax=Rhodococcus pyridinivorans TaxID=103816 RepID=UPI0022260A06|nr:hypothetical protein [Rhodococcus pyridinivorans]MCW3472789.1 hypothetical protein [Rhodococcus pyridinivorans]
MNNNENDHRPAGLLLDVYRAHRLGDCTNGGISAAPDTLLLVGVLDERRARTGRITSLPSGCTPHGVRSHVGGRERISPTVALRIRRHAFIEGSYAALVGVEWNADRRRYELTESGRVVMFGGNYAGTSDSRLGELSERYLGHRSMILPIHDRTEG